MVLPGISELEYPVENSSDLTLETRKNSYLYDYDNKVFIRRKGTVAKSSNIDSIRDWIERNCRTLIDTWGSLNNYESGFGTTFQDLVGNSFNEEYTEIEIKKECRRAFTLHPYIDSIENVKVDFENTGVNISYTALLIDDKVMEGEVFIF